MLEKQLEEEMEREHKARQFERARKADEYKKQQIQQRIELKDQVCTQHLAGEAPKPMRRVAENQSNQGELGRLCS